MSLLHSLELTLQSSLRKMDSWLTVASLMLVRYPLASTGGIRLALRPK